VSGLVETSVYSLGVGAGALDMCLVDRQEVQSKRDEYL